jgi:hypothetical protein
VVPAGATVKYVGTWRTGSFQTADGVVAQVSTLLLSSGLSVRSQHSSAGWFANLPGFVKSSFDVTLQLEVDNGLGYGSQDDIISIVRSYVQQVTGFPPQSDSIPELTLPGDNTPTSTGEKSQDSGQQGCIAGTSNDLSGNFSLQCWFSNLTTKGLGTVGILAILAVVAVGLIVFAAPALAAKGARKAAGAAEGAASA